MKNFKYRINVKDPDGKLRSFTIFNDLPIQRFSFNKWELTVKAIKRKNELKIDKLEWEKK